MQRIAHFLLCKHTNYFGKPSIMKGFRYDGFASKIFYKNRKGIGVSLSSDIGTILNRQCLPSVFTRNPYLIETTLETMLIPPQNVLKRPRRALKPTTHRTTPYPQGVNGMACDIRRQPGAYPTIFLVPPAHDS